MTKNKSIKVGEVVHHLNGEIVRISSIMELISDRESFELSEKVIFDFEKAVKDIGISWEKLKKLVS